MSSRPVIKIVWSAIKYLLGLLVLISIICLPFGGPLVLLYYWFYVLLYVVPVGLLGGAIFGLRSLIKVSPEKKKQAPIQFSFASKVTIAFIFIVLIGFFALPYFTLGQSGYVWLRASWYLVDQTEVEQQLHQFNPDCDSQLILLVPEMYDHYELICDQDLLDYLKTKNPENVPIIYHVKYDFGEPSKHSLHKVDSIRIEGATSKWVGRWSGCGNAYEHPCDNPSIQDASALIGGGQWRVVR